MSRQDGGPAFPQAVMDRDSMGEVVVRWQEEGASLRDLFACFTLVGGGFANMGPQAIARTCYAMADAMLEERER